MDDAIVPIVVVGFNRPKSLSRILISLGKAYYPRHDIPLIISIDRSDSNQDVLEIAKKYDWKFGTKSVNYNPENLGLRKHILQCGDLSLEYGSVIVLEDDLYVSPNFYNYTLSALKFSENEEGIGGISLYNHQINVHTNDNFLAIQDGYDNWYFQFASSWGQAWTKKQWKSFRDWYSKIDTFPKTDGIPKNVSSWSDKSWLKFFIAFLIDTDTYFLYPKTSLTTNFSDAGTHVNKNSSGYQVPLLFNKKENYTFSKINESKGVYDAFYENKGLCHHLDIDANDLCIDLYGYQSKPKQRFWLSPTQASYKIIKSFSRSLRPIETNIIQQIPGYELYLYDTDIAEENNFGDNRFNRIMYNIRQLNYYDLLYLFKIETKNKFKRILIKLFGQG